MKPEFKKTCPAELGNKAIVSRFFKIEVLGNVQKKLIELLRNLNFRTITAKNI
jgi:hypothetical protein